MSLIKPEEFDKLPYIYAAIYVIFYKKKKKERKKESIPLSNSTYPREQSQRYCHNKTASGTVDNPKEEM